MNLITLGKYFAIVAAIAHGAADYCNGNFTAADIGSILGALAAAGLIHTGTNQVKTTLAKRGITL